MTLAELKKNEKAVICKIDGGGPFVSRIKGLGIFPGSTIKLVTFAPLGDPLIVKIGDTTMAMRKEDASGIVVELAV